MLIENCVLKTNLQLEKHCVISYQVFQKNDANALKSEPHLFANACEKFHNYL